MPSLTIGAELIEARAAKYWRMRPSEFGRLVSDEQAHLIAIYMVETAIDAFTESEKQRRFDASESQAKIKPGSITPGA